MPDDTLQDPATPSRLPYRLWHLGSDCRIFVFLVIIVLVVVAAAEMMADIVVVVFFIIIV